MANERPTTLTCSFCGKEPRDIVLMMGTRDGGQPLICNECLYLGMEFLAHSDEIDFDALVAAAKRADDWRDAGPEGSGPSGEHPYRDIDRVIDQWVERHRPNLQTEWEGEARFWYSSRGKETFLVSVSPPDEGIVRVTASAVETDDAAELDAEWAVRLGDLERTLTVANHIIDLWHRRPRVST
jgi:ClpX C4-type zinc finger